MASRDEIEARLAAIAENRYLAHSLRLADKVEATVAEPLLAAVDKAIKEVKQKLTAEALSDFQLVRYQKMLTWLKTTRREVGKSILESLQPMEKDLIELAQVEASVVTDILSFGAQAEAVKTTGISMAKAQAIVRTPVGGVLLKEFVEQLGGKIAWNASQQLRQGAIQGETYQQIVRRLTDVGITSRSDAITIARTHVQSVSAKAHEEVREANRDIIKGVEWDATFDNRVCKVCITLDGQKWFYEPKGSQQNMSDLPERPLHPRCRCKELDIVKSWSEILGVEDEEDLEKVEDRYKPYSIREKYKRGPKKGKVKPVGVGGAPIKRKIGPDGKEIIMAGRFKGSGEQWLKAYPDVARDVLGPKRAEMVLSGKVKLRELLDSQNKPILVKDLEKMAA
jgi:SPP1 gp7 family putative phage head morphogenesis protein